ncbi:MAG: hypothetical protein V3V92_00800 [Candidatus Hydrothermarchaeales archaeon]
MAKKPTKRKAKKKTNAKPTKTAKAKQGKKAPVKRERRKEWQDLINKLKAFSRDLDKILNDILKIEEDVEEIRDAANQEIEEISSKANKQIEGVVSKKRGSYKDVIGDLGEFSRDLDKIIDELSIVPKGVGKKQKLPEGTSKKQDVIQNLRYLQQWIWVCIRDFEHAQDGQGDSE